LRPLNRGVIRIKETDYRILVINPGSTSTKFAVFEGKRRIFEEEIRHHSEELERFPEVIDQLDYRKGLIRKVLQERGYSPADFDAVAARGGRLKPVPGGVYRVNQEMLEDAKVGYQGDHASNLACLIGTDLVSGLGVPVFVVDPVSVDELWPEARLTGLPEIERTSLSHALNMKRVARKAAHEIGKKYESSRLIVAHLGGGGSISLHLGGKMVDLFNSDKEGPFSIERSGGIPSLDLVELCFSGDFTREEIIKKLAGKGGIYAHLGTRDFPALEQRVKEGDKKARLVIDTYLYQLVKYIGALYAVAGGQLDAICLTGGVVKSQLVLNSMKKKLKPLGRVLVYPGGEELQALAEGVLGVLTGRIKARKYPGGVEGETDD